MSFEVSLGEAMDRAAELNVSAEPLSYDERCVMLLRDEVRRLAQKERALYDELCKNFSVYNLLLKKLARVEALPATLREMAEGWLVDVRPAAEMRVAQATASALRAVAVMVETTLKGEP